ncbi:hypothetical protein B4U37_11460 [Sutcliffiella horikoshii]|uniref:Uncharacterized protein n=1 Tax=Sutcliffiella horikoshii TaxID=79883 RepID=A0ABN4ZIT8_9BACI|nr:hypothetical protein B4U37_11460 [Sutcliffiella horikoshii]
MGQGDRWTVVNAAIVRSFSKVDQSFSDFDRSFGKKPCLQMTEGFETPIKTSLFPRILYKIDSNYNNTGTSLLNSMACKVDFTFMTCFFIGKMYL